MAQTIAERLDQVPAPRGFNYLRIVLATLVLTWHSVDVTGDRAMRMAMREPLLGAIGFMILPMFFALGGFLVTGSLVRERTISGFITLRALRLFPALIVEVILSALILGPVLTTLPLESYFSSRQFWAYFLNIIGYVRFHLPGVFVGNPDTVVNMSLWTMPYEIGVYAGLAALPVLGLVRRRWLLVALSAVFLIAGWAWQLAASHGAGYDYWRSPGWLLVAAYLVGVIFFLFRERLTRSGWLMAGSVALSLVLLLVPQLRLLAVVPLSYVTIWLGLYHPPESIVAGRNDYSYGVYLFAFPIQQLLQTTGLLGTWYWNALGATVCVFLFAAASWHLVEKPLHLRKRQVVEMVDRKIAAIRARLGWLPAGQPHST